MRSFECPPLHTHARPSTSWLRSRLMQGADGAYDRRVHLKLRVAVDQRRGAKGPDEHASAAVDHQWRWVPTVLSQAGTERGRNGDIKPHRSVGYRPLKKPANDRGIG